MANLEVNADILAYYGRGDEQQRLTSGRQRVEFLRIQDLLDRHLPSPPARVLDIGGGAGVHALPLAAAGYEVRLVDPVPLHVEQAAAASAAAAAPLAGVSVGDARDLAGFASGSQDAALLLGPLYHLQEKEDRLAALREAHRVVGRGGVVVAKALSRFYPLFEPIADGLPVAAGDAEWSARFAADGRHRDRPGDPEGFPTSYFHRPDELVAEVAAAGLEVVALLAGSGCVKLFPDLDARLDDDAQRERLLAVLRLTEAEPSVIGMSQNFLAIGRAAAAV